MDKKPLSHAVPVLPQAGCCNESVAAALLPLAAATHVAETLKALADPTRLRMLDLLAQQTVPLCVCDITARFDQHQPTISHHLRILREAGLVDCEKRGAWAYYWATEQGKQRLSIVATLL